jgi:hypothetical protein
LAYFLRLPLLLPPLLLVLPLQCWPQVLPWRHQRC